MAHQTPADRWANGAAYEAYVGRWSRLVVQQFLRELQVPPGSAWLDVGCGTGALTQTILSQAQPHSVTGIDRSEGFIDYAREHVMDERATFRVGDAQSLPFEDAIFDAAISGLVLNFVPNPLQMASEMRRVTRPGGKVGVYVWDYADKMEFMRYFWDAAVAIDPAMSDVDEGRRFPICQPEALLKLFQDARLQEVDVKPIDIATDFRDFDDYWSPFLGGQGSAPTYLMSLPEERRTALRERIRANLPFAADGSIPLVARAWAVYGRR
jgi:SAM-dependent methyltransferase